MSTGVELAITAAEAKKLYARWNVLNDAYHNGSAMVSDAEFDRLTQRLLPFYPKIGKVVGAKPMAKHASARKVRLEFPMASLDKAYGPDVERVTRSKIGSASQAVIAEKVDGLSLQIKKDGANKVTLFTRGKDGVGQDVSHLLPHIKGLGVIARGTAIRFELVIPSNVSLEDEDSEVRRNAISGIVNARTPNLKLLAKAYPVALSYLEPVMAPSKAYAKLKADGWRIPRLQLVSTSELSADLLTTLYKSWQSRAKYAIDGLVVLANVKEEPRITNPKRSYAFKVNDAGQVTEVVSVTWQVSRYGQMKPVVNIQPIKIDGAKVSKATGHNAKYILDNRIGPGAQVEVVRSGGVIPYIVSVKRKSAKASLPKANTYEWDKTKVNIYTIEEDHNDATNAKQIQTFFAKIGALGFGPKVAELVADLDVRDIASLTSDEWLDAGAGNALAAKMPAVIKQALRETTVPKIMAYSGVFGQGFGDSSAVDLWKVVTNNKPVSVAALASALKVLPGWSETSAIDTAKRWKKWVAFYNSLPYKPRAVTVKKPSRGPLKGMVVVYTGVRDKDLTSDIEANGGTVAERITKDTTHLIYKEGKESEKTAKAQQQGIRLIPHSSARRVLKL